MVRFQRTIRSLAALMLALILLGAALPKKIEAKVRHKHILRHKRRTHRTRANFSAKAMERNRQMAIEFLRENSPALSKLVNLTPVSPNTDTNVIAEVMSQYEYDDPRTGAADADNGDDAIDTSDNAIQGPEDAAELEQYDNVKVDINEFKKEWLSYIEDSSKTSTAHAPAADRIDKKQVLSTVVDWLGTRYYYGGTTRKGIDCSAFTRMVFDNTCNVTLPRSAQEQYFYGVPVDRSELQFGDLVFFHTRRRPYVSHVGIYLGDNLFAQASSHYGVTISSLESTYYNEHFIEGRRVIPDGTTASNMLQPVESETNTQ
jgi:cell wall-associated NlpC family hydrolase